MRCAKRLRRVALWLVLGMAATGLASRGYGYNALVPLVISNLNRLQNLMVELAMSDFEGVTQAAKGIAGNAKAIHDLAHLVVTDQNP